MAITHTPDHLFLQTHMNSDTTWCDHRVEDTDVEYFKKGEAPADKVLHDLKRSLSCGLAFGIHESYTGVSLLTKMKQIIEDDEKKYNA